MLAFGIDFRFDFGERLESKKGRERMLGKGNRIMTQARRELIELGEAYACLWDKVSFLRRGGAGSGGFICASVCGLAGELGISPESARKALQAFADSNIFSMSTWRYDLWREVNWSEWRSVSFFHNRDDSNYVRLRLA
jgi:hypothetical protein